MLNQSARDTGCHDFIKDVGRLERYVQFRPAAKGYAIFLTNDSGYWNPAKRSDTIDSAFRLHQGRILQGSLTWGAKASDGTKRKREEPLKITGKHTISWQDYSKHGESNHHSFRYVLVEVMRDSPTENSG